MAFSELRTLLITVPLSPPSLLDELRATWPVVHYFPLPPFRPVTDLSTCPTDEHYASADVLVAFTLPPNLSHASQTPRLKLIQVYSAGHSHIETTDYYKSIPEDSDLTLSNASGIHVSAIGEHVLATTIMLLHKLQDVIHRTRTEKRWLNMQSDYGMPVRELRGMIVGILGYGHIGRECARLFSACGSTIIALTRKGVAVLDDGFVIPGTGDHEGTLPNTYYSTESESSTLDFYRRCDVVVNTLPDSAATRGFVGKAALEAMKGDAIFVNIGRGTTVDQEALVHALNATPTEGEDLGASGTLRIGGASLDVVEPEPLPDGHELYDLKNVILTPHMSGMSVSTFTG